MTSLLYYSEDAIIASFARGRIQTIMKSFEVVGQIVEIEVIATGNRISDIARLRRIYGPGRWRKLKGTAMIRLTNGRTRLAELHWYEANGIGRKEMKRKRYLDENNAS